MTQVAFNLGAALRFLAQWSPEGPWVLTCIEPDKKGIETRSFAPGDEEALRAWLGRWAATRNIYFHVNPVMRRLDKKAERADIRALAWLHVDIDPRVGEKIEVERERALHLLRNPPGDVPPPTVIVDSGGGYQGFWKLADPYAIDGEEARYEEAKRWNLQLEVLFGADNCHNVDRIMRLPGTINWPDAKKKRKGRVAAVARLIEFHEDRTYPLDQFKPAPLVQGPAEAGFGGGKVQISGNVPRLADVHELDERAPRPVPDWVKVLIVQGKLPDQPSKYPSRSHAVFAVCCELVRAGVDDETIFTVITDPDFGISAHVLDQKGDKRKYAMRQIERAREEAVDPWLRVLNEKHAVISNIGGKCRVVEEVLDQALNRSRLTKQSFDDFRNRYMNRLVKVGVDKNENPVMKKVGDWWLGHEQRRQYDSIVFAPQREVEGAYNLWKGFACEARPGDCSLLLAHIRENVCRHNEEWYTYLMGWFARCVQRPDEPGQVAVVLRGGKGTGKSFLAKAFGSLWGRHFLQVSNPKHLVGNFNYHLRDCVVLFGDEAFYAGDKSHESILKTLITEELIAIEAKGVDVEAHPNYTHLILASNARWVVPAKEKERRFLVLDVGSEHVQDHGYFRAIQAQLDSGGREALLHMLLSWDISNFNVRAVPQTDALQEQKIHSLDSEEEWWYNKLQHGQVLDGIDWDSAVRKEQLLDDYLIYSQRVGVGRRSNATSLGKFLARACPVPPRSFQKAVTEETYNGTKTTRPYFMSFPPLADCRTHWDANFGGPYPWPRVDPDGQSPQESLVAAGGSPF